MRYGVAILYAGLGAVSGCVTSPPFRVAGSYSATGGLSACSADGWAPPVRVVTGGQPWPAQFMSTAAVGGSTFIFADTLSSLEAPLSTAPLSVVRDGKIVQVPAAMAAGIFPKAAADIHGGVVRLIWAVGSNDAVDRRWSSITNSLWAAVINADGTWNSAQELYSADQLFWSDWTLSAPAVDARGRILFAVPSFADAMAKLAIVSFDGAHWSILARQLSTFATYTGSAFLGGDSAAVAYTNGVGAWLILSNDGGHSWSAVLHRITPVPADITYLDLAWFEGRLHVVWGESGPSAMKTSRLLHSSSGDGGGTWQPPDTLAIPRGASRLRMVTTTCGLLIAGDDMSGSDRRGSVFFTSWAGRWASIERPFLDASSHGADIRATLDGDVVITALVRFDRSSPEFSAASTRRVP